MMLWKTLKDLANSLTEEQLNELVEIKTEDGYIEQIIDLEVTEEDLYYDEATPEVGCFPFDHFNENDELNLIVGVKAGTLILHTSTDNDELNQDFED